jgi:hypothetical protein
MITLAEYFALAQAGSGPPSAWPPPPREALPPNPQASGTQPPCPEASCWSANGDYLRARPSNIPNHPDRRFHRGNFCGVRVPGLVEGGNDKDPSLMITWDLVRYSPDQRQLAINYYAGVCGYTHVVLSRPQTINNGLGLDALVTTAQACKAAGLFVCLAAVSDGDPFSVAVPWLETLAANGLLDVVCFAWQADKWYSPQDIVQGVLDNGAWSHPRGLLTTIHWGGGYGGWAESCACWSPETEAQWGIHDRWSFQSVLASSLDGHYGQCNTEADIDAVQSWLLKALVAMPEPMFLVGAEMDAQAEYGYPGDPETGPHKRLERWGDQKGYLAMCADPSGRISALNGERGPDGQIV